MSNIAVKDSSGAEVFVAATGSGTVGDPYIPTQVAIGEAAHDAGAGSNPVLQGAYASASAPTAVTADGDVVRLWADRNGRLQIGDGGSTLSVDDGAGSLTVDGTVNAAQSGTWNITNVSGTVSLPTGASTLAEQQTQTTSLQLMDNVVATTGSAIPAQGYAVSGTDGTNARVLKTDTSGQLQVGVVTLPALASGSNTIGSIASITTSVTPGTGASSLGKAEDAAHTGGDVGVMALAVRSDTATQLSSTDGDYCPLITDASGRLHVNVGNTVTVSGTVNAAQSGTWNITTLSTISNVVHVDDNASTLSVDDGGSSLTVDGTVGATQSGTWTVQPGNTANTTPWLCSIHDGTTKATVRDLVANDALNVAIVDGSGNQITTFGGGSQYQEDNPHASGDTGTLALAVRRDTPDSATSADGDYATLNVSSAGRLWTSTTLDAAIPAGTNNIGKVDVNTAPGTFAEDAAAANGATGYLVLGVRQDADTSPVSADGDYHTPIFDANGCLKVNVKAAPAAGTSSSFGSALPSTGTAAGFHDGTNMQAARVYDTDSGAGAEYTLGVNLRAASSGGSVGITGDVTNGLDVDVTRVSGNVTVVQSTAASLKASATILDSAGTSCMDDTNHALQVNVVAGGAGNGAILDGVSSSIKATVLDYTNSNPLAVRLTDTNGDYVGAGAGTQYTEDNAAAANPTGTVPILVRADTPSATVSADGDNIAQRGTNYGAAYVTLLDTAGSPVSVGGGTQYTEDAAAAANPIGNALIVVRDDARGGSLTSADGDNVALRGNNNGELYVKHTDTIGATQSGTWNITNISGTVSLPTGAATAAKQPALGTAGTPSSDVITVQGITSMTALKVDGSAVTQPVSDGGGSLTVDGTVGVSGSVAVTGTFWQATQPVSLAASATNIAKAEDSASADADVGVPAMAIRKATPANTSSTDGDYEMLQMSAGRLWTSATIDTALPAGTNAIGKLASNSGVTIGAVELAASQTLATLTSITNVVHVDDNSGSLTVDGTVSAQPAAATSGGVTPSHTISAASTNATNVKSSAGQLYGFQLMNKNTSGAAYVKFYNKATAPTVGTDTPVKVVCLPAAASSTQPSVVVHSQPLGISFGTGISFAITGGSANSDTTAVASGDVHVELDYK